MRRGTAVYRVAAEDAPNDRQQGAAVGPNGAPPSGGGPRPGAPPGPTGAQAAPLGAPHQEITASSLADEPAVTGGPGRAEPPPPAPTPQCKLHGSDAAVKSPPPQPTDVESARAQLADLEEKLRKEREFAEALEEDRGRLEQVKGVGAQAARDSEALQRQQAQQRSLERQLDATQARCLGLLEERREAQAAAAAAAAASAPAGGAGGVLGAASAAAEEVGQLKKQVRALAAALELRGAQVEEARAQARDEYGRCCALEAFIARAKAAHQAEITEMAQTSKKLKAAARQVEELQTQLEASRAAPRQERARGATAAAAAEVEKLKQEALELKQRARARAAALEREQGLRRSEQALAERAGEQLEAVRGRLQEEVGRRRALESRLGAAGVAAAVAEARARLEEEQKRRRGLEGQLAAAKSHTEVISKIGDNYAAYARAVCAQLEEAQARLREECKVRRALEEERAQAGPAGGPTRAQVDQLQEAMEAYVAGVLAQAARERAERRQREAELAEAAQQRQALEGQLEAEKAARRQERAAAAAAQRQCVEEARRAAAAERQCVEEAGRAAAAERRCRGLESELAERQRAAVAARQHLQAACERLRD
ncbi:hypothetical protein HYH03_008543 [Edaphochlamys debaryana]|uniref:Uncharacterized protein n=1 Tax=Edaphochlamys debaryana TaxID=47281 RepID=A0A835Y2E0_9CHLO|nr:hypothetical protein HYH03_008543 [Edaphochlamys debaryana]|eukprot:KAG2493418.1 hypothetical protein HYH03_008543 [Edaphochlamys debaryana]